jgi:hypothetical protein
LAPLFPRALGEHSHYPIQVDPMNFSRFIKTIRISSRASPLLADAHQSDYQFSSPPSLNRVPIALIDAARDQSIGK